MPHKKTATAVRIPRTKQHSTPGRSSPDLAGLVARYAVKPLLDSTRAAIALLKSDGELLAFNRAFQALYKSSASPVTINDLLSTSARTQYKKLLGKAGKQSGANRVRMEIGAGQARTRCECLLIAIPGRRLLFLAEPLTDSALLAKYQRLSRDHKEAMKQLHTTSRELNRRQTEVLAVRAQADEVSHTDALTLLPNRRQVIGDLQREVMSAERYGKTLTISMIDIDHFKKVNDTYGHSTGDEVLRAVAARLREQIRNPDLIGRYGGEEFLVILPNSPVRAASEQAARLCSYLRMHRIETGGMEVRVTISIGVAGFRLHQDSWQSLLARADEALYRAKNNGRDQWAAVDV